MAKPKGSSLKDIFADEREDASSTAAPPAAAAPTAASPATARSGAARPATPPQPAVPAEGRKKESHPGKKPVLIHIPADMHRILRQLSVEEGGEPITKVVERSLREYLAKRGHTRFT